MLISGREKNILKYLTKFVDVYKPQKATFSYAVPYCCAEDYFKTDRLITFLSRWLGILVVITNPI